MSARKRELESNLTEYKQLVVQVTAELKTKDERVQELSMELEKFTKEAAAARTDMEELKTQHDWIGQESRYFGQPGHKYDFTGFNRKKEEKKLTELNAVIEESKRRVNFKVDEMFED